MTAWSMDVATSGALGTMVSLFQSMMSWQYSIERSAILSLCVCVCVGGGGSQCKCLYRNGGEFSVQMPSSQCKCL